MSFHRVLSICRARGQNATRRLANVNQSRTGRWQSTKTGGRSGPLKLLLYTTTGLGLAGVGTVAYAVRDPSFKSKANDYVPGFGYVVDFFGGSPKNERVELVFKPEKRKPIKIDVPITTGKPDSTDTPSTAGKSDSNATPVVQLTPVIESVKEETTAPKPPSDSSEGSEVKPAEIQNSVEESTTLQPPEIIDHPVPHQEPQIVEQSVPTEDSPVDTEPPSKQPLYAVDSAVSAVMEETERAAEEMISEQVKEHQETQTLGEQWMQDTAEVDAELEQTYEALKTLSGQVEDAQRAVVDAMKKYQGDLTKVISAGGEDGAGMESLADDVASSEQLVRDKRTEWETVTQQQDDLIGILEGLLSSAEKVGLKSKAEDVMRYVNNALAYWCVLESGIKEAEASNDVLLNYQQETQKNKETLQSQLGLVLPEGDPKQDAIILMQNKRIELLKLQLETLEQEKGQALASALEDQKERLEKLAEEKLAISLDEQKIKVEQSYDKMASDLAHEFDSELKEKLRLQSEAHTSHMSDALRDQASQLGALWSKQMETKLIEHEGQYQAEISKAMAKLRGIESMVNTVANAGEATRYQQTIRNVCDTLTGALEQANADPDNHFTLSKELSSLREAAKEDRFLLSVIDSIPQKASDGATGVQCEASLQERFSRVHRVCKRVALVPETGGGLGTYALSYLQSLLVFNLRAVDVNKDIDSMDTFELLSLAKDSMARGNIEQAVWYVNHLKNESGRVAVDWLNDARLYLEARQAVKVIQAYTAANNIAFSGEHS